VVLGIDEDRVVRTGSHACLATNADRFVEVDNSVGALEHCCGGTSCDAGRMRALIAACHLVRASRLREDADVHVLDVSASDG